MLFFELHNNTNNEVMWDFKMFLILFLEYTLCDYFWSKIVKHKHLKICIDIFSWMFVTPFSSKE